MGAHALALRNDTALNSVRFSPQPGPQAALVGCPIEDVFYGGARGGGKTYGMLLDFLTHALTYGPYATGVFFRKVAKNLEEVIQEAHRIFPHFGGKWLKSEGTYVFRSGPAKGARLKFRHLITIEDAGAYQGHAYTWICFEEMTQWPDPGPINLLRGTLRSAHGVPCLFRATGNPGNAGHNWVKARYISPAPRGFTILTDAETGERRVFIPSKLDDNQILMRSDPRYEARLRSTGTKALVRAWRFGDWDIVAGGFFDDLWREDVHVLKPFEIPSGWTRRRSFDWGSSKPGSLGMYAISDGTQPNGVPIRFPRGSVIRFAEWYTAAKDESGLTIPNVGLKLSNDEMGQGIAKRSLHHNWHGCVADPSIFVDQGGPSIYKQMVAGAAKLDRKIVFTGADNTRVAGWQRFRQYLEAPTLENCDVPGLYVFENCIEFIRTVPVLQMDAKKPDDVDSDAEDHIGDETRYLLMSLTARGGTGKAVKLKVKGR